MEGLRIPYLRRVARHHYQRYHAVLDTYDCGTSLAEELSATARNSKLLFNKAMDKLGKLDPDCPTTRL